MKLRFDDNPVRLESWEITTKAGQRTRVALTDFTTGTSLNPSLFNLELATANYR